MINKFTVAGVLALMLAMFVIGIPLGYTDTAQAGGDPEPTATNTSVPTATPCGGTQESAEGISAAQVAPTCTPVVIVKSATPTASATSEATETPAATEAPATATKAAATATAPGGGTGGEVIGPNTGTGDGTSSSGFSWYLLAGVLIAVGGAGSLAYGVRRRR